MRSLKGKGPKKDQPRKMTPSNTQIIPCFFSLPWNVFSFPCLPEEVLVSLSPTQTSPPLWNLSFSYPVQNQVLVFLCHLAPCLVVSVLIILGFSYNMIKQLVYTFAFFLALLTFFSLVPSIVSWFLEWINRAAVILHRVRTAVPSSGGDVDSGAPQGSLVQFLRSGSLCSQWWG